MPDLSVIVPLVNELDNIRDCLAALARNQDVELEVVVVDRLGKHAQAVVKQEFPWTMVIPADRDSTIPQMRAMGFWASRAEAVAVIEDHVIVPADWGRQLLDALHQGAEVAGGCIENAATRTLMDWASFLCEYSACLPPLPAGEATWLPGNNIVYRRSLLEKFRPVVEEGKWENHLHDAMRKEGVLLICHPEIVVGHKLHQTFGGYLSQRYLYARSFAGARVDGAPPIKRFLYGTAAFCLPPLLYYRTVRRILAKRKHLGYLIASLPLLGFFVTSWGIGEVVGYWFGSGNSLSRVR